MNTKGARLLFLAKAHHSPLPLLTFFLITFLFGTQVLADPVLTIRSGQETKSFTRTELLTMPSLKKITVTNEPTFPGTKHTYWAVPVVELFKGITLSSEATIVFKCSDGFSAPLSKDRLLNKDPKESQAWIAIEKAGEKWPPVKPGHAATAGPFYLIWPEPEKSKIGANEWPYQLAGFEVKASVEETFPLISPGKNADEDLVAGFKLFVKNCFACHTLNGEGASNVGPDLNIPFSPTEYLERKYLKLLIRNPQLVRKWPKSSMPGFTPEVLSDEQMDDVIGYLEHMAERKAK